ncbi:tetratricopeptide repeat protein [Brevibacillus laterosporus]|uniref:tetratricopeptide repeat protein n=1 Tax=Brevibacillus laterosporus TaxID=1465 RepID=UPI0018CD6D95|nr:tetratricopeptide repeat protein [Brevibacillus laterosporus]MBG9786906.1 hypothetical protein [Brevibacillus laterosporus]
MYPIKILNSSQPPSRELPSVVSEAISKYSQKDIAKAIGVDPGALSRCLRGKQMFDLNTIDKLTLFIGEDRGYFYSPFIESFWRNSIRSRSEKIRFFIKHCMESGLDHYADGMIDQMIESEYGLTDVYETALELKTCGKLHQALKIFERIIKDEPDRSSEILALSYYYKFLIVRNIDLQDGFEAAVKLGEHIQNLNLNTRAKAMIKMINLYFVLDKWKHVESLASDILALIQDHNSTINIEDQADALVNLGFAYEQLGRYDEALAIIDKYSKFNFGKYAVYAEGNKLILKIFSGDYDKAYDLCNFVRKYREEASGNLGIILGAFVKKRKHKEIQEFLNEFSDEIKILLKGETPHDKRRIAYYKLNYVIYLCDINSSEWEKELLDTLRMTANLKMERMFKEALRFAFSKAHVMTEDTRLGIADIVNDS